MPEPANLSTPLAYALAYAAIGWHVLPLEPNAKQPLGRLVPRGMLDATTDQDTIRAWWAKHPQAGIGIALAQSGLVAIDVDPRNGGADTFEQLQAVHGSLRSEVMALTGGGGEHHVFVVPHGHQISLPGTLGPGIDLKANGYIVVEPSVHPSGKAYGWEYSSNPLDGVAPSPLPDWLRSLRVEMRQPTSSPGDVPQDPKQARDAREALYLLDADNYDDWVHAGMALHATRWGHPAYAMWCAWSQQSPKFDATVCRQKWASFSDTGERRLTLAWVFDQAQKRGWQNPAAKLATTAEEPKADYLPILNVAQLERASAAVSWAIKHTVPANSVGIMFGASGTFKSFVALDMALHMVHGLAWLGKKTKKCSVLFVAAEGGTGLWRRVKAWHQARGLKWDGIEFYTLPLAVDMGTQAVEVIAAAEALGIQPGCVIVDTLSQTFSGEENSATDVSAYLRGLGNTFRALWSCVVMVIHHSGHNATERPRGSSAIQANTDFMFGVFRDEKEMLATVTNEKQKDGERFADVAFKLTAHELGRDEDGEAITSLVARQVGSTEELVQVRAEEARAGRGGRVAGLMAVVQNGMAEKALRLAFYDTLDLKDADAKKHAYYRARDMATKAGYFEIVQGVVVMSRGFA